MRKRLFTILFAVCSIPLFLVLLATAAPCGTIQSVGDCTPLSDPTFDTTTQACAYYAAHPDMEHIGTIFQDVRHCASLGGEERDGFGAQYCRLKAGVVPGFPYIPGIFARDNLTRVAEACSAATGIPAQVLLVAAGGVEWWPGSCPSWPHWSVWADPHYKGNANATTGNPGQADVPSACYDWTL